MEKPKIGLEQFRDFLFLNRGEKDFVGKHTLCAQMNLAQNPDEQTTNWRILRPFLENKLRTASSCLIWKKTTCLSNAFFNHANVQTTKKY